MKKLKWILLPFALLYGGIVGVRNLFYDWGIFSQYRVPLPSIGVGNLSVGGTGKSVVVAYLAKYFKAKSKVGMVSRGYGRSTRGVIIANSSATATSIGDEPMQLLHQHPEVVVAVAENRTEGTLRLMEQTPDLGLLLYDDCLQHRSIHPQQMLLTTTYQNPYSKDFILPVGQLREARKGAVRAGLVLVTKCPLELSATDRANFQRGLKLKKSQQLIFTNYQYASHFMSQEKSVPIKTFLQQPLLLITGIADPQPLLEALVARGFSFEHRVFEDHHKFTTKEVAELQESANGKQVLTTEKDYMRLAPLWNVDISLFYWPIELGFDTPTDEKNFHSWLSKSDT